MRAATPLFGFDRLGMMTAPAQARPDCDLIAHKPATGLMVADGHACATKKKCNCEFERKKQHGLGRGALGAKCGKEW